MEEALGLLSALSWEELGSFLYEGVQNNGVFEFYAGQLLSLDRHSYSWDLSQQDGADITL